jgi:hypothetical protein
MGIYGVDKDIALWSSALFIVASRLLAWKFDLTLGR